MIGAALLALEHADRTHAPSGTAVGTP
jgi:hypothetical protein